MTLKSSLVNGTVRFLTGIGCRLETSELAKIPLHGPLILVSNHINFLETPVVLPRLSDRPVTALAKVEYWKNPFFAFLFNIWDCIPIRRGESDLGALQAAVQSLNEGKILIILPEGTRSSTGILQSGHAGIILIALRSGAPILPLVHYGGENVWENIKHFRRTNFKIKVGKPFRIEMGDKALSREVRQQVVDEIMYQLAALLPEEYRGVYSDMDRATQNYLHFELGENSNLAIQ